MIVLKIRRKMKSKNKIKNTKLLVLLIMLISFIFLSIITIYEINKNTLINQTNTEELYQIYFTTNPLIKNRLHEGNNSAKITIIAVLDLITDSSSQVYKNTISKIREEYVNTNQVKIYYKYYLTEEDILQKTNRYKKAKIIYCYIEANGSNLQKIHEKIILQNATDTLEIHDLEMNYPNFIDCTTKQTTRMMEEDLLESIKYKIQAPTLIIGITGQDNIVLYGEPTEELLRRTIRNQQIKIGI